ncbi:MAG TPA: undecaprenyl-diphosphate phosphatase [Anaerohalosphaeraceae bacterium]|jgi:undecaprenyl-diphosphatase|nr:undecaprenyl-diphosphate phosphatase [Anaerohalosphaeraceae bacterium]HRT51007.1 undecaprenyl-diphosphate phosphatase [Anaerohalosphaeraceae bacterium]HRT86993.1 undecaprenyl-diphosphate phosphatase [Anaerohalosphaeraceae bacterium]
MTWWEALILGIIQGVTEFFPVSSSGHLVMGSDALGLQLPGVVFEVCVHVATLVSVLIVYRRRIQALLLGLLGRPNGDEHARSYLFGLVLASVPAAFVGFLFKDWFEARFSDPAFAATMLLVTGCMVWSIRWAPEKGKLKLIDVLPIAGAGLVSVVAGRGISFVVVLGILAAVMGIARATASQEWHSRPSPICAIMMGVAQAVAILPGISRSGSTVLAGTWRRLNPAAAAEFSFLMSVIVISAAGLLMVPDAIEAGEAIGVGPLLVGCAAAMVSGILAIRFFLVLLRRQSFHVFAYYCWFVGCLFLLLTRR